MVILVLLVKMMPAPGARSAEILAQAVKLGMFEAQLDYDGFSRNDPSGYASWIGIKAGINIGL